MINNPLRFAWRQLAKNRIFALINMSGLAVAVACSLLLFFYISHESSFDSFHRNKDRIFRLEMKERETGAAPEVKSGSLFSFLTKADDMQYNCIFPLVVGPDLETAFPEVKHAIRMKDEGQTFKLGNSVFSEPHVLFADASFFSVFSFPLIKGNAQTVLASKQQAVLSQSTAKKYFGDADPMGRVIEWLGDEKTLLTVAGVAADAPANSSIQFDVILPTLAYSGYEASMKQAFNESSQLIMVELADGVSAGQFQPRMNQWVHSYFASYGKENPSAAQKDIRWSLRPLTDCHYNVSGPWGHYTNSKSIYELSCLVIIILLIASLNHVLLSVSNTAARSAEVGVRKVIGAGRRSLIWQFWMETQVLVFCSVLLGLVLGVALLPLFGDMIGTGLAMSEFSFLRICLTLVCLVLGLGLVAGFYPALVLSGLKPLSIMRGFRSMKINPIFGKTIVVVQYTACVILMVSALVMYRQMQFVKNKDLGFDKSQVLILENPFWRDPNLANSAWERLQVFAAKNPNISQVSSMNGSFDGGANGFRFLVNGESKSIKQLEVDYAFFDLMKLHLLQGRTFSKEMPSDTSRAVHPVVINESLLAFLGKDARLGRYNESLHATIIGVVKDYHFASLNEKIEPLIHFLQHRPAHFLFRINPGKTGVAISQIASEWKKITTDYPLEYRFVDQEVAKMYEADLRWQKTVSFSCLIAVIIACMGLFGLSAINANNRIKEIGIRKLLGAGSGRIVMTLSGDFLFLVTLAIIIATPLGWWLMNRWLQDFAYRTPLNAWAFVLVAVLALLIAFATVSILSLRAARANPAESLKEN